MQMQEPEQRQWQAGQANENYHTEYSAYESEQQSAYEAGLAVNDYQEQKIYPQAKQGQRGKLFAILGVIFSSTGFFLTLAGIIISAFILQFADGRHVWLVGGGIGLAVSILLMLVSIAIWIFSIVWLALHSERTRRRLRYRGF